ncbi:uncharacterized protein [Rutidosis leptorrhynchoides]|uniref:uncharacterized protein n=1 Tax=Rutidosis leptorrhynchoides TaxID=125765 RepID=UPI003A99BCCF
MKILTLNVRGLGVKGKFGWVKSICFNEKPDIIALQETRCKLLSDRWVHCLWDNNNCNFVQKEVVGKSGGLLLVWDINVFVATSYLSNDFFLAIRGNWVASGKESVIVNVYGPHDDASKKCMWSSLDSIISGIDSAWMVCGDFNEAECGTLNDSERKEWLNDRKAWLEKENIKTNMLKQKAKNRWITEGDENSKFFHASIKRKYNKCNFRGLNIDGRWNENPSEVKEEVKNYFQSIFESKEAERPRVVKWIAPGTYEGPTDCPNCHFVRPNLCNCTAGLHTHGPDGPVQSARSDPRGDGPARPVLFDTRTVGPDLLRLRNTEANNLELPFCKDEIWAAIKECGASFITLVPKVTDPTSLNEYRHISLISSYYKIVAKLLSNRLRKVIPSLVGTEQSAFIKGRNILDGVLIANEIIEYVKRKKSKCLIFKVDFEKAFDSLSWEFLMEVMGILGLGSKWRQWILACLKSATISILVNGSPTLEFNLGRGVRQGDPLSPFLFIIAAEGLNALTKMAVCNNRFSGVEIGKDKVCISHLQYADDTIFFGAKNDDTGVPFTKSFVKVVGNGSSTSFWHDVWVDGIKLCDKYKRLFKLESNSNAMVADRWVWNGSSWCGSWDWSRISRGRTGADLVMLVSDLNSCTLAPDKQDSWQWQGVNNGEFTTKRLTHLIDSKLLNVGSNMVETLRNNFVPKKFELLIWRSRKKRIPTFIELDKHGIDLHSVRCPLCDDGVESVDHALLFCKKVFDIWEKIFKWWGFNVFRRLVCVRSFKDLQSGICRI